MKFLDSQFGKDVELAAEFDDADETLTLTVSVREAPRHVRRESITLSLGEAKRLTQWLQSR